ncbi:UTP--glucose-1-phosphate uridylyltransferase [Thiolapillus sp.]
MIRPPSNKNTDKSLVAAFVLALVFATPFTSLWSCSELPWYLPYLLWLGAILFLVLSQQRRNKTPGGNRKT